MRKTKTGDAGQQVEDPGQAGAAIAETIRDEGDLVTGDGSGDALPPVEEGDNAQREGEPVVLGDGGAREAEVGAAFEHLDELADSIQLASGPALVASTVETLVEFFKHRPKPWTAMSQSEQRDLIAASEYFAKELVRNVVEELAADDRTSIRALLESYTEKDGIKVTLKVKTFDDDEALQAVIGLHKAQGKHVMITVASADDYAAQPPVDQSEPEQASMGFESDDHPDDDSDLAGEETATAEPEIARTGFQMLVPDHGLRQVQVNLTTGMVEWGGVGGEGEEIVITEWHDLREATPDELAAERDRIADFDEGTQVESPAAETTPSVEA